MTYPSWHIFEDEVFEIVSAMAQEGDLSVNPNRVRPRRKPRYFSAPRKADIEFEISLEIFDEGASEPSRIWLWECKDKSKSGRKVPVSDIESLQSKLYQLGAGRFSASIVTTNGFQDGAYELAVASGISLFVLEKKLVRITQFSCNETEQTVILPIVSKGLSFQGVECEQTQLDEMIIMYLEEMCE
jgi:hypothetical protein